MALMNVNQVGNANFVQSEWFVARITAVDTVQSGTGSCVGYKHSWIEQRVCANGIHYQDADEASAENSDGFLAPAYPINNVSAFVNDLVLMRVRGVDQSGNTIYEFIPRSSQWFSSSDLGGSPPSNSIGNNGDFFQDIVTGATYIKQGDVWILLPGGGTGYVTSVQCTGGYLIVTYG